MVIFRVDASVLIGSGHLMRCLTLAEELHQSGTEVCFITCNHDGNLNVLIQNKGFKLYELIQDCQDYVKDAARGEYAIWLGTTQEADAAETIAILKDIEPDWLIVDHYAIDETWEQLVRPYVKKIMVIDDLADRQHDCDVLLDQNYYADMDTRYIGKVPEHCRLLLGPRYALLRDEFRQLREKVKIRTGPVKRILVFFGGVDANNYTEKAIEALVTLGIKDLHVDVVIGAQHPYRNEIEAVCQANHFFCHVQTSRMAELMAAADLSIGAGGSATWERCCLGLPTIALSTVDNQVKQVADAAVEGLLYSPDRTDELAHVIQIHFQSLQENLSLRRLISCNAMQAVDGRGVLRLIGEMGCSTISIRVATAEDSEPLFLWRNHPSIRQVSRNLEEINWNEHQQWFARVLNASDRLLLLGERDEMAVGVVRFDIEGEEAEVSIYLVPGVKVPGLGRDLLQSAEHWLAAHQPAIRLIRAQVLGDNVRSHHLFLGADYKLESTFYLKKLHDHE